MSIVFGDPPRPTKPGGSVGNWDAIATELIDRPKEWAMVVVRPSRTSAANTARNVRSQMYAPLRDRGGRFESISRTVDGEYRVYARFMPEGTS